MNPINFEKLLGWMALTTTFMFIAHWIPMPTNSLIKTDSIGKEIIDRITRYIIGTTIIMGGLTGYFISTGDGLMALLCWLFAGAGGMAVLIGYGWDSIMNRSLRDESDVSKFPADH